MDLAFKKNYKGWYVIKPKQTNNRLEFELAYNDVPIQYINYYFFGTLFVLSMVIVVSIMSKLNWKVFCFRSSFLILHIA